MWLSSLSEAKSFHPHDPRLLVSVENLAGLYASLGRFDQARPLASGLAEFLFKLLAIDHRISHAV